MVSQVASGKDSAWNAGDSALIPVPGEGNGNLLQYFCLGNLTDKGAWWATVHGVTTESNMTKGLNNNKLSLRKGQ